MTHTEQELTTMEPDVMTTEAPGAVQAAPVKPAPRRAPARRKAPVRRAKAVAVPVKSVRAPARRGAPRSSRPAANRLVEQIDTTVGALIKQNRQLQKQLYKLTESGTEAVSKAVEAGLRRIQRRLQRALKPPTKPAARRRTAAR